MQLDLFFLHTPFQLHIVPSTFDNLLKNEPVKTFSVVMLCKEPEVRRVFVSCWTTDGIIVCNNQL